MSRYPLPALFIYFPKSVVDTPINNQEMIESNLEHVEKQNLLIMLFDKTFSNNKKKQYKICIDSCNRLELRALQVYIIWLFV